MREALVKADPRYLDGDSLAASILVDATRETYNFLEEVAVEVPYARYFGRIRVQMFERMRALALSDTFEDVTEDAKAKLVKPYTPEQLRSIEIYKEVLADVERSARRIADEKNPQDFIDRVGMRTARALERVARKGGEKERGKAAAEIFERQMPKMTRGSGVETRVVVLSERSAALLKDALADKEP